MGKKLTNKKIAPVIISLILIGYHIIIGIIMLKLDISNVIKISVLIFSVVMTILVIKVLIERIKEINEGEENDLSKY